VFLEQFFELCFNPVLVLDLLLDGLHEDVLEPLQTPTVTRVDDMQVAHDELEHAALL